MRRRAFVLLSVVGLLILTLVGLHGATFGATAQQGTPGANNASQVVGAWLLNTNPRDPTNPLSVAIFNRDGTYHEDDAVGSGAGTWQATGPNTAILTIIFPQQNEKGQAAGILRVRASITVAADGASFTAPYTLEFVDAAGKSSGQLGPATATGTRITAEAPGTPVGPIPAGTPAVGTPTS